MEMTTYRPGIPSWIELPAPDPGRAAAFYCGLLGWQAVELPGTGGRRVGYLRDKPVAAFTVKFTSTRTAWLTYVAVDDADAAAEAVVRAGGQVAVEPAEVGDEGRAAVCVDPTGAAFGVWQARAHPGAVLVNEPGTLRRNELETRTPELAIPFYREVFGWEPVEEHVSPKTLFDWHLYDNTVAGLMPMDGSVPAEVPSHWMVYFDVDDVDMTAKRAVELAGTVYVPPSDVSVGRFAVLGDSQGAVFGVLRLRD